MSLSEWKMATKAVIIKGGSVRRIANERLASPRVFSIDAPLEDHDQTAMIGAAEDFPRPHGIRTIPVSTRMTIDVTLSPRPPESSTPKDAAMEGASQREASRWVRQWVCTPFASDTDVVLAGIQAGDDARDSGAGKLSPGVFSPCAGLAVRSPASSRRFGN